MVDFLNSSITTEERDYISSISNRARLLIPGLTKLDAMMCLEAVHSNGCKLKLKELSQASDVDLVHDVVGIYNNMNRSTGELEHCFYPRFAV